MNQAGQEQKETALSNIKKVLSLLDISYPILAEGASVLASKVNPVLNGNREYDVEDWVKIFRYIYVQIEKSQEEETTKILLVNFLDKARYILIPFDHPNNINNLSINYYEIQTKPVQSIIELIDNRVNNKIFYEGMPGSGSNHILLQLKAHYANDYLTLYYNFENLIAKDSTSEIFFKNIYEETLSQLNTIDEDDGLNFKDKFFRILRLTKKNSDAKKLMFFINGLDFIFFISDESGGRLATQFIIQLVLDDFGKEDLILYNYNLFITNSEQNNRLMASSLLSSQSFRFPNIYRYSSISIQQILQLTGLPINFITNDQSGINESDYYNPLTNELRVIGKNLFSIFHGNVEIISHIVYKIYCKEYDYKLFLNKVAIFNLVKEDKILFETVLNYNLNVKHIHESWKKNLKNLNIIDFNHKLMELEKYKIDVQ